MSELNRRRVRELFMDLSELPTAQWRAALEAMTQESAEVRAEVARLLELDEKARGVNGASGAGSVAGFMENPTATTLPVFKPISEKVGSKIGVYKLLEVIGEGGFGTVFMAEQSMPVRRRVALKIIKLGMDTRQVVARFEQERQALALMDHPNIAKVYDAGATETGRPFFVMEYVRGEPITRFVADRKLTLRARLELLLQVCRAVQHAHTKGVIHRDIKPSNVLVSVVDGKPLAKVIDFGIAKATGAAEGRLTEKTLFTEHRQLIGTLEYMSPEQVEGSADIDTRSDVYGLGVLLYEMLTGETPIDGKRLRSAGHGEIVRIIREVDPQVPSVRVTGSVKKRGASAAGVKDESSGEGVRDPWRVRSGMAEADEHVPRMLRGELDWIVMKALEKDRSRRYESPSELAEDIERHLTGQPVQAAPVSKRYRLMKFVRRNRAAVIGGVAVSAALLVGLAGTAWKWRDAVRSEREAVTQAELAGRNAMQAQLAREEAERKAEEAATYAVAVNLAAAQSAMRSDEYAEARRLLELVPMERRGWEHAYLMRKAKAVVWAGTKSYCEPSFSADGRYLLLAGYGDDSLVINLRGENAGDVRARIPHGYRMKMNVQGTMVATLPVRTSTSGIQAGSTGNTGSVTGAIRLWDLDGKEIGQPIFANGVEREQQQKPVSMVFGKGGEILTVNGEGEGQWWSAKGERRQAAGKLSADILNVRFNERGDRLIAMHADDSLSAWSVVEGGRVELVKRFPGKLVGSAFPMAVLENGDMVATWESDRINIWNVTDGGSKSSAQAPKAPANAQAYQVTPDGEWAVRVDLAPPLRMKLGVRTTSEPVASPQGRNSYVNRSLTANSRFAVISGTNSYEHAGSVEIFDLERSELGARSLIEFPYGNQKAGKCRWSPDGRLVLLTDVDDVDGRMAVLDSGLLDGPDRWWWDPESEYWFDAEMRGDGGEMIGAKPGKDGKLAVVSPDGKRRFVLAGDRFIRVESGAGVPLVTLRAEYTVKQLFMSANGKKLGLMFDDDSPMIWDISEPRALTQIADENAKRQRRGEELAKQLLEGPLAMDQIFNSLGKRDDLQRWERFEAALGFLRLRRPIEEAATEEFDRLKYLLLDTKLLNDQAKSMDLVSAKLGRREREDLQRRLRGTDPSAPVHMNVIRWSMVNRIGGEENARRGVRLMREIMEKSDVTAEKRVTLAMALYRSGEYAEALTEVERARSVPVNRADWEEMLYAMVLKKCGREDDAVKAYQGVIARKKSWEQNSFVTTLAADMKELFEPASSEKKEPQQPK